MRYIVLTQTLARGEFRNVRNMGFSSISFFFFFWGGGGGKQYTRHAAIEQREMQVEHDGGRHASH